MEIVIAIAPLAVLVVGAVTALNLMHTSIKKGTMPTRYDEAFKLGAVIVN